MIVDHIYFVHFKPHVFPIVFSPSISSVRGPARPVAFETTLDVNIDFTTIKE